MAVVRRTMKSGVYSERTPSGSRAVDAQRLRALVLGKGGHIGRIVKELVHRDLKRAVSTGPG